MNKSLFFLLKMIFVWLTLQIIHRHQNQNWVPQTLAMHNVLCSKFEFIGCQITLFEILTCGTINILQDFKTLECFIAKNSNLNMKSFVRQTRATPFWNSLWAENSKIQLKRMTSVTPTIFFPNTGIKYCELSMDIDCVYWEAADFQWLIIDLA